MEKSQEVVSDRVVTFQASAGVLRRFAGAASCMADEVVLEASPTGLVVRSVDPAHVAMVDARYGEVGPDPVKTLCDLGELGRRLKAYGAQDELTVTVTHDGPFVVTNGKLTRTLPGDKTDGLPPPKAPKLDWPACFGVDLDDLATFAKTAQDVSDHCSFVAMADAQEVTVMAEGDDTNGKALGRDTLRLRPIGGLVWAFPQGCATKVSLDYLQIILKAAVQVSNIGQVEAGVDLPIRLTAEADRIRVAYWLAPRIESP